MFQECLKGKKYFGLKKNFGLKICGPCFKKVTRKIEGCFEGVLRVFHESLMEEEVLKVFQECFERVSRKLSRCFKKVSCCMAIIAAARAEGGLVS